MVSLAHILTEFTAFKQTVELVARLINLPFDAEHEYILFKSSAMPTAAPYIHIDKVNAL